MDELKTMQVALKNLIVNDGFHQSDPAAAVKLEASVRRYGQLRPLVVRKVPKRLMYEIVDGRKLVAALEAVGAMSAWCVVAKADDPALELACALTFPVDYARLAYRVVELLEHAPADKLAAVAPWSVERLNYFKTLSQFDWKQFAVELEQEKVDWQKLYDEAHEHGEATLPEEPRELTPADEVPFLQPKPKLQGDLWTE